MTGCPKLQLVKSRMTRRVTLAQARRASRTATAVDMSCSKERLGSFPAVVVPFTSIQQPGNELSSTTEGNTPFVSNQQDRIISSLNDAAEKRGDSLLDIDDAAEVLNVEKGWLYKHAKEFPFAFKLPKSRMWRFSQRGIDDYIISMTQAKRTTTAIIQQSRKVRAERAEIRRENDRT